MTLSESRGRAGEPVEGRSSATPAVIRVEARGRVPCGAVDETRRRIAALSRFAPAPILLARVSLTRSADPAVPEPATALALLDVGGRPVHARATGHSMHEAIAELADRLRIRLQRMGRDPGHD